MKWLSRQIEKMHHRDNSFGLVDREPGDTNIRRFGFDLHPQVSFVSGGMILLFIALTLWYHRYASEAFHQIQDQISSAGGWFFILVVNVYLGSMIYLAFSRYGAIRIGGPDARPDYSSFSWYSMLMAAGTGIGLIFWSVAEPIKHFGSPPGFHRVVAETPQAAREAMVFSFYHWGLHAWGIYSLVGLSLAFFAFNRGLPLTIRSTFFPILGEKIYGWWGHLIDILSVIATLFGLATSLGLGVGQVNAGLSYLFGIPISAPTQVVLIGVITLFATGSVVSGLDSGVRRLSELNMIIALIFMLFVLIVGPTTFLLGSFVQNLGTYAASLPALSFWTETFVQTAWQKDWTVFYWGWWISWSPFVGMFIARISRGRTVREFVFGVLLFPSLLSFFWLSVFGGAGLYLELNHMVNLSGAVDAGVETALFTLLEQFPLSSVSSFIGVLLVVIFFVTSSDSGSLVVDHLTSGGTLDSPVPQRIFWALLEGAVAAVLLVGGGLTALQTASISTGFPFSFVLLVMIYTLLIGLRNEYRKHHSGESKGEGGSGADP